VGDRPAGCGDRSRTGGCLAPPSDAIPLDFIDDDRVVVTDPPKHAQAKTPKSQGVYRIPYANGTGVEVSRDHHTHTPRDRIDMHGVSGNEPYRIVAAAAGEIMFIVDSNTEDGGSCDDNNYVWIKHTNGEWTKYSHLATGSVRGDAGLDEGDAVSAGRFLGYEDDIGCASGEHLHFEVAIPDDPTDPIEPSGGYIIGKNRVPRVCWIPGGVYVDGETYTAKSCTPPRNLRQGAATATTLRARCPDADASELRLGERARPGGLEPPTNGCEDRSHRLRNLRRHAPMCSDLHKHVGERGLSLTADEHSADFSRTDRAVYRFRGLRCLASTSASRTRGVGSDAPRHCRVGPPPARVKRSGEGSGFVGPSLRVQLSLGELRHAIARCRIVGVSLRWLASGLADRVRRHCSGTHSGIAAP
jgi:hypothetical protein